ncbi:MAG: alkaline phosphatase family protein [Gemmatimonadota bacterium]
MSATPPNTHAGTVPSRHSVLLVFLDGIGIGSEDPRINPFIRGHLPALTEALGGTLPTLRRAEVDGPGGRSFPIDACLGVGGTPQSGTGQIALLTGRHAPRLFGRHFGPWPPVRLRAILEEENVLVRAVRAGARVAFANAYPEGYPEGLDSRRVAAPPLAARSAGVLTRHQSALVAGDAVASEIINKRWIEHMGSGVVPTITPAEAGANLARIASLHDLTLYAHYETDVAGHRGGMDGAIAALERVDRFLGGVLERIPPEILTLVVSDHGNIEDVRTGHTRNPVLGLALGGEAKDLEPPRSLIDVVGFLLHRLGCGEAA